MTPGQPRPSHCQQISDLHFDSLVRLPSNSVHQLRDEFLDQSTCRGGFVDERPSRVFAQTPQAQQYLGNSKLSDWNAEQSSMQQRPTVFSLGTSWHTDGVERGLKAWAAPTVQFEKQWQHPPVEPIFALGPGHGNCDDWVQWEGSVHPVQCTNWSEAEPFQAGWQRVDSTG
eukprot:CAMPEP_0113721812 /NCGR_PEP_ID=MMETSP0038_2-20120614/37361_1 /TAXON_ID=2898 /ORGANISM="Cryptomonas paramecium" /LENGTH=170 /DNA_ID=CAMNT_0000650903 /DNA_START=354 /DNA_END=866 /DNA_ORIENTATION=+ /assembly_acc=CAM_ASM_000170